MSRDWPSGDLMKTGGKQAYRNSQDHRHHPVSVEGRPLLCANRRLPFLRSCRTFKDADSYYEGGLRKQDGSTNKGAFGRAFRNISDDGYGLILAAGFAHVLGKRDRERPAPDPPEEASIGLGDNLQMPYQVDSIDQRIVSQVVQRPFRDRAFSVAIKAAYQDTPALSRASS